jgi:hypothetical protein
VLGPRLRRALVVLAGGAVIVSAVGCSSTEQESARIAREGAQLGAAPAALKLGAVNRVVHVSDVTLLSGAGRTAVAVKLTNDSPHAQASVPLVLTVTGAGHKILYSNAAGGLEASLQHLGELDAHRSAWWVDDQVSSSQPASAAKLRAGRGSSPAHAIPALRATAGKLTDQAGVSVLGASVANGSGRPQGNVAVFVVARRAGRVVAAGRAVIAALGSHAHAPVQVFLVGDPAGAKFELDAVAAVA